MTFVRQTSYEQIDLRPPAIKRNVYNTPITSVTPAQNEVFLFSSRLTHTVDPNVTGQTRYAIAFNTFIKGKLGDYHTVSELVL
jgi:ectoine hydroxylase-related dioxygenase (phytanoyl-CoA dioxygenase family)